MLQLREGAGQKLHASEAHEWVEHASSNIHESSDTHLCHTCWIFKSDDRAGRAHPAPAAHVRVLPKDLKTSFWGNFGQMAVECRQRWLSVLR